VPSLAAPSEAAACKALYRGSIPLAASSSLWYVFAGQATNSSSIPRCPTYRRDLATYVLPQFGTYSIGHIPADEIELWLNAELDRRLSPSSVHMAICDSASPYDRRAIRQPSDMIWR
jgi:hypothetical protein